MMFVVVVVVVVVIEGIVVVVGGGGGALYRFIAPLLHRLILLASRRSFLSDCNLSILDLSFSHRCILIKGSRPFIESICHGFGLLRSSLTEPCDRPNTTSPKIFWPRLCAISVSLMRVVIVGVSSSGVKAASS